MAKEIMKREASDNKYMHKDFHNLMNLGLEYLREKFGEESVREYLKQFASSFYAPLKKSLEEEGLAAIMIHYKGVYEVEEALEDIEFDFLGNNLVIRIAKCPAVKHMKKSGVSISPLYYETIKTVNETICENTAFTFELLEYDHETGASVQRFYKKVGNGQ